MSKDVFITIDINPRVIFLLDNKLDNAALEEQLRDELLDAINDFKTQSEALRDDLLTEFQNRKNQIKDNLPPRP